MGNSNEPQVRACTLLYNNAGIPWLHIDRVSFDPKTGLTFGFNHKKDITISNPTYDDKRHVFFNMNDCGCKWKSYYDITGRENVMLKKWSAERAV